MGELSSGGQGKVRRRMLEGQEVDARVRRQDRRVNDKVT